VAQPVSYIDRVRDNDSVLAAYEGMKRRRREYVAVLDGREHVVGVVTRQQLAQFLRDEVTGRLNLSFQSTRAEYRKVA
jgi:CBS-domain-containing membrane protein